MAVRRVQGVSEVEGDVQQRLLRVWYDPEQTSVDEIRKVTARAGYPAELA